MSGIAMQIELVGGSSVGVSGNVMFNNTVYTDGNISYDNVTGEVTFNQAGRYIVHWWVATQNSFTNTAIFAFSSSQDDFIEAASPFRTSQVVGMGIINVSTTPVTASVVNVSAASFTYATAPVQATLIVVEDKAQSNGPAPSSQCFSMAQLAHVIEQLTVLYPTSVMSVFTTNLNVVTGTPYQLYASPDAQGAGIFILINSNNQYEAIPLLAITAIYAGDGTTYQESITYLTPPTPLPDDCALNLSAAVRDYLPISTDVLIQLGVTTQATGLVHKNEYSVLVLSDETGSTPIFISVPQIVRIITEDSSENSEGGLLPGAGKKVEIKNTEI